jgi:hypothetical protein
MNLKYGNQELLKETLALITEEEKMLTAFSETLNHEAKS